LKSGSLFSLNTRWVQESLVMEAFLKSFLKDVAYPAVAGNLAWAFVTLAIDSGAKIDAIPRLGVLFVLTIYFSAEWYRSKEIEVKTVGLWLDLLFVLCMVWFAIGTQANKGSPGIALIIILLIIGLGHLLEVWLPVGRGKGNTPHGITSLVAAAVLGSAWYVDGSWNWALALVAICVVLAVWAIVRQGKT
jgi:hypothetical protein